MTYQSTDIKRVLSYDVAEWACALKYEHLSPEAIQAAKLFWFDSIGCALGGTQQEDAKILLRHYRAMGGGNGASHDPGQVGGDGLGGGDALGVRRIAGFEEHRPEQRRMIEGGPDEAGPYRAADASMLLVRCTQENPILIVAQR